MSDTERLRAAAESMRATHGPEHDRHLMWAAIADWLETTAAKIEAKVSRGGLSRAVWHTERHADSVASAYLAALSPAQPDTERGGGS